MTDIIKLTKKAQAGIIKIARRGKDKYEIYFDFLSVPVIMNKDFLSTILSDFKNQTDKKISK